jgi:Asp-tRNA(Asn)/Glu-tRNA(Gln) amidotransferase A subunit family amidase
MKDLAKLSLVKLIEAIKKKKISPVELMKATLKRLKQTNTNLNTVAGPGLRDGKTLASRLADVMVGNLPSLY